MQRIDTAGSGRPRVLVTIDTLPELVACLAPHFELDLNDTPTRLTPACLRERLHDKVGAIICGSDRIDDALLGSCPELRAISSLATGTNNIDLDACQRRNVQVTHVPNVHAESVADHAWALMMSAARRVVEADAWLRGVDGAHWQGWAFNQFLGADVHGKTLGLVGFGMIGQALARRASGFAMKTLYFARHARDAQVENHLNARFTPLDALLRSADHVIVTVPYSRETHHLIGRGELALMKPSATFVNVARGGVIDDVALIAALQSGRIRAAGLDVFENEPHIEPRLRGLKNVVMTPHIGSATDETRRAMAIHAAECLIRIAKKMPQDVPKSAGL